MKIDNITEGFGAIVRKSHDEVAFDLDRDEIIDLIKTRGVVLFTGFDVDLEGFNRFTALFSDEYMSYKGGGYIRTPVGDGQDEMLLSTKYDYGREKQDTFGLPLHGEMYYMDNRPVLLWFYCGRPADSEGETTVCDGSQIYDALSDEWKDLLGRQRLKYSRRYLDGEWQKVYQTEDPREAAEFCGNNGLDVDFDEATRTLKTNYVHPAVITSRWGGHTVYINNILPVMWQESMGRETSIVRFEDGSRIPQELVDEVVAIQQRLIQPIAWKAGDFAVIDNTRSLHGRRAFADTERDVYLRMVRSVDF